MIGLVGANGAGKSTLLTTVAGVGNADIEGTVTLSPPDATVGYLGRTRPDRGRDGTRVPRPTNRRHRRRNRDERRGRVARGRREDLYSPPSDKWLALGGAVSRRACREGPRRSGSRRHGDAHMTDLSGGQAARAGLASLLLSRYDVLLLDEPTNDLDLPGLEQLEQFVAETRTALVVSVTIGVPGAHRHRHRRTRSRASSRSRCTTAGTSRTSPNARWPGGTRARPTTSTQGTCRHSRTAHRCNVTGSSTASAMRAARPKGGARTDGPQGTRRVHREAGREGAADAAPDRALEVVEEPPQGVGVADGDRRGAAQRCGRGHAQRCRGPPRRVHVRSRHRTDRLG
ncbi:ATP-binding cassette domain-containing protein [Rhodococcus hoagii]|nr:ATP-binding cassette domain-containing protein [Prescottella equi]